MLGVWIQQVSLYGPTFFLFHYLPGQPVPVLGHAQWERVSWCTDGASSAYIAHACCVFSCHWATLKRTWRHLLYTLPSGICTHWWGLLWTFSSPDWTIQALSACSQGSSRAIITFGDLHWALWCVVVSLGLRSHERGTQLAWS